LKRRQLAFFTFFGFAFFAACGAPGFDSAGKANALLISSVLDAATVDLNRGDCSGALRLLLPIEQSPSSNNDVRMVTASAYGCQVNLKPVSLATGLTSWDWVNGSFWGFSVKEFPSQSNPDDGKPQFFQNGIDAVLAALNPGVLPSSSDLILSDVNNPGALLAVDRTKDSNLYLAFLSIGLIGTLLSRGGEPSSTYARTVDLPWMTPATTLGSGCALASAMLHLVDSMNQLISVSALGSGLSQLYGNWGAFSSGGLNIACSQGCADCGLTCSQCPLTLRNRNSCKGLSTDLNSCAAAGINKYFINTSWSL
jgi:hypothetical protein